MFTLQKCTASKNYKNAPRTLPYHCHEYTVVHQYSIYLTHSIGVLTDLDHTHVERPKLTLNTGVYNQ